MIRKLVKLDNNFAIIIDKPILDLLNIDETTSICITTDGNTIILQPLHPTQANELEAISTITDKQLREMYLELVEKYSDALERLSKN